MERKDIEQKFQIFDNRSPDDRISILKIKGFAILGLDLQRSNGFEFAKQCPLELLIQVVGRNSIQTNIFLITQSSSWSCYSLPVTQVKRRKERHRAEIPWILDNRSSNDKI